ncbi:MAG: hypothetical protein JNL11_20630 [Bdellovibrionaceae bacterium]|nr:hypothetical protein [Pseudobdellovibrionaceae bacterium]
MKNLGLLILLIFSSTVYAGPFNGNPNLDPQIACVSMGTDSDGAQVSDQTKFKLQFKPLKNKGGPTTDKYSLTVSTEAPGQPPRIETSAVKFTYYQQGSNFIIIALTAPNFDQSTGRFTSYAIPGLSRMPFIIYGWSTTPKTVRSAIEYRCAIQSAY